MASRCWGGDSKSCFGPYPFDQVILVDEVGQVAPDPGASEFFVGIDEVFGCEGFGVVRGS